MDKGQNSSISINGELPIKRNQLSSHTHNGGNEKCILLSERSQCEKTTYCMISSVWYSKNDKIPESIKRSMVAKALEERWIDGDRRCIGRWH
jgi:hypothetical protein